MSVRERRPAKTPLIVFSHLRWDPGYHRPRHVVTRLARSRRVLFIEEPNAASGWDLDRYTPTLGLCRARPSAGTPGFDGAEPAVLARMVRGLLAEAGIGRAIALLYTPAALPLARALEPDAIVYECTEELAAVPGAPARLAEGDAELLACADLVFTDGRSLHRTRRSRHPNVHCVPSSVDVGHFAKARHRMAEPPDQRPLPSPRLGFFGTLDARLDPEVLDAVAGTHPEWQIVLLGPLARTEPAALPERPNLHYLGSRPYAELPGYLAGWDVGLLPLGIDAATRFTSPSRALELMAAARPIVSTPIPDVVERYGSIVHVGDGPSGFVAACERALRQSPAASARRQGSADAALSHTSWDRTVAAMERLIGELARGGEARRAEKARRPSGC